MGLFDALKSMFSTKKKLSKVTTEELRKERIRLEQIESRVNKELSALEQQKQELFVKGKDETSERQQVALARKIKEVDVRVKGKHRQLAMISRQLRILGGISQIKENEKLVQDLGVSSLVSQMDLGELEKYVEGAIVEGQFHMDRFAQILKTMEMPGGLDVELEEDDDTLEIVAAMQEAKQAESADPEAALNEGVAKVDEILHKEDEGEDESGMAAL
jgi:hypothetical protein